MPIGPIWPNSEEKGQDWQCCLASSSKTAPRIFIFSIVLGAEYLSYVKSIQTHARAFFPLNISTVGSVNDNSQRNAVSALAKKIFGKAKKYSGLTYEGSPEFVMSLILYEQGSPVWTSQDK